MFFSKYDQWKTQSPPDYSPAYEQAEEEVRAGDFEDEYREEFEEELGWDEEPEEGNHERWLAKAEMAYENYGWREWYNVVQSYFPKTCDVVETRLVERRAEEIIEDHGGPW